MATKPKLATKPETTYYKTSMDACCTVQEFASFEREKRNKSVHSLHVSRNWSRADPIRGLKMWPCGLQKGVRPRDDANVASP
ncbi:unnamed protein product [Protopolystoma xenopodis]|uniref:Uncharacterized protein n=1 Tax=Protopolystoma xenopodis TaxID=117903 RepID=A0A448XHI1_9PLAT|nr:unnamed protein product [Protopolystoma xenopodis]